MENAPSSQNPNPSSLAARLAAARRVGEQSAPNTEVPELGSDSALTDANADVIEGPELPDAPTAPEASSPCSEPTEAQGELAEIGFEGQEDGHEDPDKRISSAALAGLRKAIARRRIKKIEEQLDRMDESGKLPPKIAIRNDRKGVKMGKRGAVNYALHRVHGEEVEGRPGVVHDWNEQRIEIKRAKLQSFEGHRAKLDAKKTHLEAQLGISREDSTPQTPTTHKAEPLEMLSADALNDLRKKEVKLPTQEAYVKLLQAAMNNGFIDESVLDTVFGEMATENPVLARFTVERLIHNHVIDRAGRVLKSTDQIESMLSFDERRSKGLTEQKMLDLFTEAESYIEALVKNDASDKTDREKENEARIAAWHEKSYEVEEPLRPLLIEQFTNLYKRKLEEAARQARKTTTSPESKPDPRMMAKKSAASTSQRGRQAKREPTEQEKNAGSSLEALRNIIND